MDFMKRMKITRDGYTSKTTPPGHRIHLPSEVSLLVRKYNVTHFDVYLTDDGVFLKPQSEPMTIPVTEREWTINP